MTRLLNNTKIRRRILEGAYLLTLLVVIIYCFLTARDTINSMGMSSGFGFLERTTGFDIGFSLIEFSGMDSYARLLFAGLVNTLFLGIIGIVGANLIALVIALFRISGNGALALISATYIEIFRNIPLILQILFWYAILSHLPAPRMAEPILGGVFLTARGLFLPGLNIAPIAAALWTILIVALVTGFVFLARNRRLSPLQNGRIRMLSTLIWVLAVIAIGWAFRIPDTPLLSLPELRGLNIRGGLSLAPELSAMIIAISLYGGAYIAEILRAGFNSAGKGSVEAGWALGISKWYIFTRIRLPLAIRAVLPTLTNQYVWLMKATTLGVAIGFADFFSVISVSINQSGQTLELIGLLMLGFLVINNTISIALNRVNKAIRLRGTQARG